MASTKLVHLQTTNNLRNLFTLIKKNELEYYNNSINGSDNGSDNGSNYYSNYYNDDDDDDYNDNDYNVYEYEYEYDYDPDKYEFANAVDRCIFINSECDAGSSSYEGDIEYQCIDDTYDY